MKRTTIEFTIDLPDHGTLTANYECEVRRTPDSDSQGRKWFVPNYTAGLLSCVLMDSEDEEYEWEFGSGEDIPRELKLAMKEADGELSDLIESKMKQLVNDEHYTGE
jgi:hypothetical protein